LAYYKIKEPKSKNVHSIVHTYNRLKGDGIEIFYDLKKGKLFVVDYFRNFNNSRIRKVSSVENELHMSTMTVEHVMQEIEKIKQKETNWRLTEEQDKKEQKMLHKEHRKKQRSKELKTV